MKESIADIRSKLLKLNELRKKKTIVLILSTMRSGSTLLKSLIATAPDASHLPEIDFQRYNFKNKWRIKMLSEARIIVLKKPAPFDAINYPVLPEWRNCKKIVLVRDAYETVMSIKKMNQLVYPEFDKEWSLERLVHEYWYKTYNNIMNNTSVLKLDGTIVKYEDLIQNPLTTTKQIFQFIGSQQREGVAAYLPPRTYKWKWGVYYGVKMLKTLKVQNEIYTRDNKKLLQIIKGSKKINQLRSQLGY